MIDMVIEMTQYIYARTSTKEQNVDQQATLLSEKYPEAQVVKEQCSGTNMARPQLEKLLGSLKGGDELIIYDLSRLSRNTADFLNLLESFDKQGIGLIVHNMGGQSVDSTSATGKMILTILTSVNQMQVELMKEKQAIGIATAKAEGRYKGRKPTDRKRIQEAMAYLEKGLSKEKAAKAAGIGVATLYRALKTGN